MKRSVTIIFYILTCTIVSTLIADKDVIIEIPDMNLEQAIRDEIGLSDSIQLTTIHMNMLRELVANENSITDLTGLEYATNLEKLALYKNFELRDLSPITNLAKLKILSITRTQVEDLTPIKNLTNLQIFYLWGTPVSDIRPLESLTQLVEINAAGCIISDISPLKFLTELQYLTIYGNDIEDITPLSNLVKLIELNIRHNRIDDVSPLSKLVNLRKLWIQGNQIIDHSQLDELTLEVFEYDQSCVIERQSVLDRIDNKSFPSIFSAWGGIGWSPVLNLPEKTDLEHLTLHDLYFCCLIFGQEFRDTPDGKRVMGELSDAIEQQETFLKNNPNMLFIVGIAMRQVYPNSYPVNSPYWLRDENGNGVVAWTDGALFLDFTNPVVIDKIVQEAIAVDKCGLYDGIFFDWWNEDGVVLADGVNASWGSSEQSGYRGFKAEQDARDKILTEIRSQVSDDFLILVNTNRGKIPRSSWAINGTFMETLRDNESGYTYKGLKQIEDTLSWAEQNLREPRINCLEGWGIKSEDPGSTLNERWMRVFTTMSLTHSNGYVLYNDGIQHEHNWYDFWDTDIGKPTGNKTELYDNREGLFIREFTDGWVVYNRSGDTQTVEFPQMVIGVTNNQSSTKHSITDLDGEIFLKSVDVGDSSPDVNGDGEINILDLVFIASSFNNTIPDLNGDGIVNILDLIIIANAI